MTPIKDKSNRGVSSRIELMSYTYHLFCRAYVVAQDTSDIIITQLRTVFLMGLMVVQRIVGMSNRSMVRILRFVTTFLLLFATLMDIPQLSKFVDMIPSTHQTCIKMAGLDTADFQRYAVCPKCHTIYSMDKVIEGRQQKCKYVRWPQHSQWRKRKPCNTRLLKGVTNVPKLVYSFKSISSYLKEYVHERSFVERCNEWRKRTTRDTHIADIYDGTVWQSEVDGYLKCDHNLYGMINIDWFQPYKHTPHSVGAIYMTILNLPRVERFKEDNVMLIGVMPGPKEPSLNINSYLQPLIEDLRELDAGKLYNDYSFSGNKYRFRLLGCSSDLPATRKLGGFLSYHAKNGRF